MFASTLLLVALATGTATALGSHEQQLWFSDGRLVEQATEVLDAMREAEVYGLRPGDYRIALAPNDIDAVLAGHADARLQQRFEAALSGAASRFIGELHSGRVDARTAGFHLPSATTKFDVALGLRQLASSRDVALTLASFEPPPIPYKQLKAALAQYRQLAKQPILTQLPPLPRRSIAPAEVYVGAPQLRRLLVAAGDLASSDASTHRDELTIDPPLTAGMQKFQRRHGLEPDGVIGPRTFAALSTPFDQRVLQLELSMERWRWLTAIGRPNIVVNIPQFMLFALPRAQEPSAEVLEMRVIVGETYPRTRTPVFTSAITQVVFQPYWDVPSGILKRELLPRIRKDPSFLDRYQMEIVQGQGDNARVMASTASAIDSLEAGQLRLRQRPGPANALGPVKFAMPNPYNVYLHATPERGLFERSQRTFSHGCIRVSEPAALAAYVLRDAPGDWNSAAIDAALCGVKTLRVQLNRPVAVVVFYSTAVATQSEGALFFDDVYGHDRRLQELLGRTSH